jgi:hypothetical protein
MRFFVHYTSGLVWSRLVSNARHFHLHYSVLPYDFPLISYELLQLCGLVLGRKRGVVLGLTLRF